MEIPQHAPLRFCSINEEMQTTANRCLCCVFIQKTLVYSVLSNTVFAKSKKLQIGAVVLYLFVFPHRIYNERHATKEETENISMDFMTRSSEKNANKDHF